MGWETPLIASPRHVHRKKSYGPIFFGPIFIVSENRTFRVSFVRCLITSYLMCVAQSCCANICIKRLDTFYCDKPISWCITIYCF
jgi:hypothetical protein